MNMKFKRNAIAVAVAGLMASPGAFAFDDPGIPLPEPPGGTSVSNTQSENQAVTVENDVIDYENRADVHLIKKSKVRKWVDYSGKVEITGEIPVDSAGLAIADDKQLILDNWVNNAHVENDANVTGLAGNGNVQVNAAAGDVNAQGNDLAIAVANEDFNEVFGSADAEAFVYQSGEGNVANNLDVTNTAQVADVTGNGNAHVNATAGNFNMQKNALVVAVASGRLAEANVYDKQELIANATENEGIHEVVDGGSTTVTEPDPFDQGDDITTRTRNPDEVIWQPVANTATAGGIADNGNVGVNVAAGTNLLQANKVSIANVRLDGFPNNNNSMPNNTTP